jgi:hypothetical protein
MKEEKRCPSYFTYKDFIYHEYFSRAFSHIFVILFYKKNKSAIRYWFFLQFLQKYHSTIPLFCFCTKAAFPTFLQRERCVTDYASSAPGPPPAIGRPVYALPVDDGGLKPADYQLIIFL